ncbi:universal stress protein [Noviherbaspirillum denitrificans]|uniref:UspA domain-containing protein n=1 Tax=Noviherbaspirillum denitrificans TaxID=1968433 RepID=A0A254TG61_9BURK|nr:universal stress protein [Noviherbaspirillum denitrificans]OWW21157.1 hypothetical protein AYR66_18430 [Noviherbaspirillum denitrificans]
MYNRILLPTDGSEQSRQAVESGIIFARNMGAAVVGLHVLPRPHKDLLDAWMHHDPGYATQRLALFDRMADEALSFVSNAALGLEVPCICRKVESDEPHAAIVAVSDEERCNLIYLASHGWKGQQLYLGTVTLRVLRDSRVPVLVYKPHFR